MEINLMEQIRERFRLETSLLQLEQEEKLRSRPSGRRSSTSGNPSRSRSSIPAASLLSGISSPENGRRRNWRCTGR